MVVLEPFKEASLLLESLLVPTSPKCLRVLVALFYNQVSDVTEGSSTDITSVMVPGIKNKLATYIDDADYFLELAIAAYLDPRTRSLKELARCGLLLSII